MISDISQNTLFKLENTTKEVSRKLAMQTLFYQVLYEVANNDFQSNHNRNGEKKTSSQYEKVDVEKNEL